MRVGVASVFVVVAFGDAGCVAGVGAGAGEGTQIVLRIVLVTQNLATGRDEFSDTPGAVITQAQFTSEGVAHRKQQTGIRCAAEGRGCAAVDQCGDIAIACLDCL